MRDPVKWTLDEGIVAGRKCLLRRTMPRELSRSIAGRGSEKSNYATLLSSPLQISLLGCMKLELKHDRPAVGSNAFIFKPSVDVQEHSHDSIPQKLQSLPYSSAKTQKDQSDDVGNER